MLNYESHILLMGQYIPIPINKLLPHCSIQPLNLFIQLWMLEKNSG